jgi:hypothetical protein
LDINAVLNNLMNEIAAIHRQVRSETEKALIPSGASGALGGVNGREDEEL